MPQILSTDLPRQLRCRKHVIDLSQPQVMGILNITVDSFYDGNKYLHIDNALRHAETMVAEGAAIVDLGGESTRPNAQEVTVQEELDRVMPILEQLVKNLDVPISVDTSKPAVMLAAHELGASFINDVRALTLPGAMEVATQLDVPVCLMHMQNQPANMQHAPTYKNVVQEIKTFLSARIAACCAYGKVKSQLIIDPGFGFGKTTEHNLQLLRQLREFQTLGCPVLVGLSRKSMIGQVLNVPVEERLYGSLAAAVIAYLGGATIIRVHDVKPTVQALQVAVAVKKDVVDAN